MPLHTPRAPLTTCDRSGPRCVGRRTLPVPRRRAAPTPRALLCTHIVASLGGMKTATPRTEQKIVRPALFMAWVCALLACSATTALAVAVEPAAPLPEFMLTDRTARALGVVAGDTVDVSPDAAMRGGRAFRVAAVYRPHADPYEVGFGRRAVRLHLPDLESLLGSNDRVDRFVLKLRDPSQSDALAADVDAAGLGLRAYTSGDLARRSSSTFVVVSQFHKAIGFVSLLAGLVFLVALMVLKFEAMRRELATLRLIGIARRTLLGTVVTIAAAVAVLGSAVGVGLGALAVSIINPLARHRYDSDLVFARLDWGVVALAVALSLLLGVLAGLLVALRHARGDVLGQIGR